MAVACMVEPKSLTSRHYFLLALLSVTSRVSSFTCPPLRTQKSIFGSSPRFQPTTTLASSISTQSRPFSGTAIHFSQSASENTMAQLVVSLCDHLLEATGEATTEEATSSSASTSSPKIRLILASQSPRRQEILNMMGLQNRFTVNPSPLDESLLQQQLRGMDPIEYTRTLAQEKAMALAKSLVSSNSGSQPQQHPTLILGSDTIVAHNEHILEKPTSEADAVRMLRTLQGDQHEVHTAVALVLLTPRSSSNSGEQPQLVESFTDTAEVTFATLSDDDIASYVATGEPMDKAGSYGIQGVGGQLVSSVTGDFFTVMGLPMHRTSRALASAIASILEL